jgi:lambda repressor-like predicted transcriptional regulator
MGLKVSGIDLERTAVARQAIADMQRLAGVAVQHTPVAVTPVAVSRSSESPAAAARVAAYISRNFPTKVQFAQEAGIGAKTLSRLLKPPHHVSNTTWFLVAKAMGIEPDELLRTGQ